MRWLGSIAVHVVLGGLLLLVRHRATTPPTTPMTIEVIAPSVSRDDRAVGAPAPSTRAPVATSARRRATVPLRAEPKATRPSASSLLGDVVVESSGGGEGGGTGGNGGGGAGGRGRLAVDPRTTAIMPVALPAAPKLSKARPAILVFPSRQTEVEDAALYVAEVIVDDEGFVVGSKLARGFGGARDAQAGAQVWRFRYSPALDDDGRPIRSTVQQKFAVAW